jgi:catechol 2,3-dioxygenase-like lactoylglutathione lyase family enzyme
MTMPVHGIHHVTAIAGDPQANMDFYAGVLGLHLVKVTVNYDDPHTYHLYYGDDRGQPGTILTFFPWPGAPQGRIGTGQVTVTAFAIPGGSLGFWVGRLKMHKIEYAGPSQRFDEEVIALQDPDGLHLELVAGGSGPDTESRPEGAIPGKSAIQRFRGVTVAVEGYERTAGLLTATLGLREVGGKGNRFRYAVGTGGAQGFVDLLCLPSGRRGQVAVGTVHHIAWRTPDDETQQAWRAEIARLGYNVTPIVDRSYFRSIYFREPGGVLFEIATDLPGFAVDEPPDQLGGRLTLPTWMESTREDLATALPALRGPQGQRFP